MKRLQYILGLILLSCIINLSAQESVTEIHLAQAGTLSTLLSEKQCREVTHIKITGEVNEADIALLQAMASSGQLSKIDLSQSRFGKTDDPLLKTATEYFLPCLGVLQTDHVAEMEQYETALGHTKNPNSLPGFWTFFTHKGLFFMTGYMNGWDQKVNEVVLKTEHGSLIRSPQIRSWIESMGYQYKASRTDGDLIFHNETTQVWCLLHFTPYNKNDYPGIHFSSEQYDVW